MKQFYVYQYLRAKSSKYGLTGSPYYIGKGFGYRAFSKQHNISKPNDQSLIQFIAKDMNESDALQLEMLLIYHYGRIDIGTGCLHNRTSGGQGVSGRIRLSSSNTKMIATRILHGKLNVQTPESVAKQLETKKKNGTLTVVTPESVKKGLATKLAKYGSYNCKTPESYQKQRSTQIANGTVNTFTTESRKLGVETRRRNGSYNALFWISNPSTQVRKRIALEDFPIYENQGFIRGKLQFK